MKFENNLQILRKNKELSQGQLAKILNVSRQSISKWESGTTYPEMDKLIQLSEYFDVSLDDLIKGDTEDEIIDEIYIKMPKNEYNRRYQRLALGSALGISLIILGVAIASFIGYQNNLASLLFFIFLTIGVVLLLYFGIAESSLDKVSKIDYPKNELADFNKKFSLGIALGVGVILFGIVLIILLDMLNLQQNFIGGFFLLCVSFAVFLFVYFGIQKEKFIGPKKELAKNNPKKILLDKISAVIMLISTIVFFIGGFGYNLWHPGWAVFIIGGLLCAIASVILE